MLQAPNPPLELALSTLVMLPRHDDTLIGAPPAVSDKLIPPQLNVLLILLLPLNGAKSSMLTMVVPDV